MTRLCRSLSGSLPAIACIAIAACAAQAGRTAPSLDGPLYGTYAAWAAEPRDQDVHAARERSRGVRGVFVAATELPNALRPFTDREIERIASVQEIVHAAAQNHELPPDLVNGIIWVESRFQVQALSSVGCRGLMQLMPGTGREVAHQIGLRYQPDDPEFNIHAGTYYFARLVYRYSSLRLALAAYNIGPAVVDGWQRQRAPLPERSQAYVDNVFSAARAFRALNP